MVNLHDETALVEQEKNIALIGLLVVLVVSVAVVLLVAVLINRSLNPITQVAELMQTIAGGNLSQDLPAMNTKEMQ